MGLDCPQSAGPARVAGKRNQMKPKWENPGGWPMLLCEDPRQTAHGIRAEDFAQYGFRQCQSLDRTIARLNRLAGGEEVPFAVVGRLQGACGPRVVSGTQREVRRVEDAILVFEDELPGLFAIANHQVADPRGHIDYQVGESVEAFRQPVQVLLITSQVAADHPQLRIA